MSDLVERLSEEAELAKRGEPAGLHKVLWCYCPECGSYEKSREFQSHKVCAECGQDWHSDIDYTDVVRRKLSAMAKAGEPVAWAVQDSDGYRHYCDNDVDVKTLLRNAPNRKVIPLYTAPPAPAVLDENGPSHSAHFWVDPKGRICTHKLPYSLPVKTVPDKVLELINRLTPDTQEISDLVNKFLSWPIPDSVRVDDCATEPGYPDRSGTNLLTATEARQMLEYVLSPSPAVDNLAEAMAKALSNQDALIANIRRLWEPEKTERFAKHLLGTNSPAVDGQDKRDAAYEAGWKTAARWAGRGDMLCDIGFPGLRTEQARSNGVLKMTREQLIETLSESMRKNQFDEADIQLSVDDIADDVMGLIGNIKAEAVREGVLLLTLGMDERDLLEYASKLEKGDDPD